MEKKDTYKIIIDSLNKATNMVTTALKYKIALDEIKEAYEAIKEKESQYKKGDWVFMESSKRPELIKSISDDLVYIYNPFTESILDIAVTSINHKATTEEVEKALIKYAKGIYKVGMKVRGSIDRMNGKLHFGNISALYCRDEFNAYCGSVTIYNDSKGWAEIIEPDYENSLKEVFYYGDEIWIYKIHERRLISCVYEKDMSGCSNEYETEIMTKASVEKWIEDNKPKLWCGTMNDLKCTEDHKNCQICFNDLGEWLKDNPDIF